MAELEYEGVVVSPWAYVFKICLSASARNAGFRLGEVFDGGRVHLVARGEMDALCGSDKYDEIVASVETFTEKQAKARICRTCQKEYSKLRSLPTGKEKSNED